MKNVPVSEAGRKSASPVELPAKTEKDQNFLRAQGWRLIGKRRAKYGWRYYWDRWDGLAWSKQYIQGAALSFQRGMNKRAYRALGSEIVDPASTSEANS